MITQETTRPEPSSEQLDRRALIATFKEAIKADAVSIRAEKCAVRAIQRESGSGAAGMEQFRLGLHRVQARARLLIYGTLRDRSWDRMEPKHAEKNGNLRHWITKLWNDEKTEDSDARPASGNRVRQGGTPMVNGAGLEIETLVDAPAPFPEPKVYVLVRRDLPWPVRTVQAAHAVMQLVRNRSIDDWGRCGPAVVLLGVTDELDLLDWLVKLPNAVGFREPDLWDSLTAVAYYGEPVHSLSELRLM